MTPTKRQRQILEYLKRFIEQRGYSPSLEDIKRHFRLSAKSTVHEHIEALVRGGHISKSENLARSIELKEPGSSDGLLEVPLVGIIAAGEPIEAIEIPGETVPVPRKELENAKGYYALKVRGDSMIDEGILDGDTIIVKKQATADNGQTVVAIVDDNEATLKRLYREKGRFRLQPANQSMLPIYTKEVEIRGIVVSIIRNLEEDNRPGQKVLRVIELFAGVGGFRVGLEAVKLRRAHFRVVWSNQWEPATVRQHASETYAHHFGLANHSNENIASVKTVDIPDHNLLTGGFPCQDYSVARTLSHATGIVGKKGILWWQIYRILKEKGEHRPDFLMLENVDRMLKSPASRRGRDFAVMLASLADLGYAVEWRVINAADYGMPQRRRRVYILCYRKGSHVHDLLVGSKPKGWLTKEGLTAHAFPTTPVGNQAEFSLKGNLTQLSETFNAETPDKSPFLDAGLMLERKVLTMKTKSDYKEKVVVLGDILIPEKDVPQEFFIKQNELPRWEYLKGGKHEGRTTKDGFNYSYNEGPIAFPDSLGKPSRTVVTGEGGPTPSRFKHVVKTSSGKFRRLTPVELERLCMFPDDHTKGQAPARRAFLMGNALVVGVITKLGEQLLKMDNSKEDEME